MDEAQRSVKIVRTCFSGGELREEGKQLSLPESQAIALIRLGKAVLAGDQQKTKPATTGDKR